MVIIYTFPYIVKVDLSNFQIVLQKEPGYPSELPWECQWILEGVVK